MFSRQKRATDLFSAENGKIAKKAIAEGVLSVMKSNEDNPTVIAQEAVKVATKTAVKKKVIKKTAGNF